MATKISELNSVIGAGARTNKYRVLFPYLGKEIDIMCHEVSSPGRALGVVDVYLKGREIKIAGDRGDAGQITISFYNDPSLLVRNFFLKLISEVQSYEAPMTIDAELVRNYVSSAESLGLGGITNIYNSAINVIDYFNQIRYNLENLSGFVSGAFGQELKPFYQSDIVIQQLGDDEQIMSETILMDAWVNDVSEIQYTDESGDISRTTITISHSGIKLRDSENISTIGL